MSPHHKKKMHGIINDFFFFIKETIKCKRRNVDEEDCGEHYCKQKREKFINKKSELTLITTFDHI